MSEQQVLDLVHRWTQAELHGDADAFDGLLSEDFAGIGPVGFTLDKQQWAGRYRGDLKNHHFEVHEPQVRFHGDTAIVSGVQEQRTTVMGHDVNDSFRVILVAVRQDDRWLIANIQLSGPLQSPGGPPPFAREGGPSRP
ncbi:nuclear transport factor 2 family protein [Nonomuraea sp. M3C6]|uniref:Nuclear transport factor 2 family protein n=1 Tax=Nonomuraea marmarensis TaxID=3351344 RepID=A0ABW7AB62_9ACTN